MNTDKILSRVRKLLAMAGDTTSPNEAAIAAKRARFLMNQHQISEWDLKKNQPEDFGSSKIPYATKPWVGMLGIAMGWLNDVNCRWATGKRGQPIMQFDGYLVDAVTAKELFLYLIAQSETQAQQIKGRKEDYKQGFASGVQFQVREILKDREKLQFSDGTSLVVSKRAAVTDRFGAMTSSSVRRKQSANYAAGIAAGKKTGLNRQVETSENSGYLR